ncbi:MAG: hypothetical protein E6H06_09595 [Bacteroidetes bacterium]|nr:MAG: hypothetical protein E6H06_09595 [Bacteroidota bacterium]
MRITITTLAFAVIILSSCQKERDFANQSAAGNTTSDAGGLLVKMVQRTGTDSLVTTYGYDGSRRLILSQDLESMTRVILSTLNFIFTGMLRE